MGSVSDGAGGSAPTGGAEDATAPAVAPSPGIDKPIYTISVASEILSSHPRTLMMYEHLGLVVPQRTGTNRRRYSQRNILALQAIQKLTREHGLNLASARYVIVLLQHLDSQEIARPETLSDINVTHVRFG